MVAVDTEKYVLNHGIHPSQIDDSQAVDLELEPGDISIHNPHIVHGSNANFSDSWPDAAIHTTDDVGEEYRT